MLTASPTFLTANAKVRKEPVFLLTIAGYSRVFSNKPGYGTNDWLVTIGDHQHTVNDLDGGSDLTTLTITVQDGVPGIVGNITLDFPTFTFEGKKATLQTGFVGQSTSDFLTIFTGVIDTVASSNDNEAYDFNITDDLLWTTQVIYKTGDDGFATDSAHPKTLNAHPLDILIDVIKNQLGRSTAEYNEANILSYRDSVFAGLQFTFEITSPPAAQDFIEQQLMQPLGGYIFTNAAGQIDVHFSGPKIGPLAQPGALIGSFADGTGQIIGAPFLVGFGCTLVAPAGATQILMGIADSGYYWDNAGSWYVNVDDNTTTTRLISSGGVGGNYVPWEFTGGINSAFPITDTSGSHPPLSVAVTAGHTITVTYVSGTASIIGFGLLAGPLGPGGFTATPGNPAYYAFSPTPAVGTFSIDETNTIGPPKAGIPTAGQADLVNEVSFRFDSEGGSYKTEVVKQYLPSITLYTQHGQQIIQSDGMRSGLQGYILAAQTSALIFERYGKKNLHFDNSVVVDWTGCVVEVGDVVALTNRFVPDRTLGVRGITAKLFEVLDRTLRFSDGVVTLSLLDTGLNLYKSVYIAPAGEPVYTSASALDKGHYMFMCDNTDKYSNGDAANLLT